MKWYTCTPVAFGGGPDFFARDSGLLSRGFRELGFESKAVMPGFAQEGDDSELIRTDYSNLESAEWWRTLGLDGLVLYAWGRPKFRGVAQAVQEAGIRLVLNQDSGGLVSPRLGWKDWLKEQRVLSGVGEVQGGWAQYFWRVGWGASAGMFLTDPLRARHLKNGDWITAVSPVATGHYQRLCEMYGGKSLRERVAFVPHPVNPVFSYDGQPKKYRMIAVGRWDDFIQKRAPLLSRVLGRVLEVDEKLAVDLVGEPGGFLKSWHDALPSEQRSRVLFHGKLQPAALRQLMQQAQVAYCPSAFESFHIASAEALCCGASVVAGTSASLASFEWFVSDGDGSLALSDDDDAHQAALEKELRCWENGERDASVIASRWCERVHASRVALKIIGLFEKSG